MTHIKLKSDNLMEEGLLMEVDIMPSLEFIKKKGFAKSEIPTFRTMALFDTGAKLCAVDKSIIDVLQVAAYKTCPVKTPFHTVQKEVYQLIFKIPGKKEFFPVTAILADLSEDNYKAIIGRDFLQYCLLVYDGSNEAGYLNVIR